jgi:hypothetical protein
VAYQQGGTVDTCPEDTIMSKASRRKKPPGWRRRKGESREGVEFRRAMLSPDDEPEEALQRLVQSLAAADPMVLDPDALAALCTFVGCLVIEGFSVVVIQPHPHWCGASGADFDRRVQAAGLTRYARPAMPGDGSLPPPPVKDAEAYVLIGV